MWGEKYTVFELVEDTKYRLIQGAARRPREGEAVSGDSYAFIYLDSGQVLMSLSDGMGSGSGQKGQRADDQSSGTDGGYGISETFGPADD